jgi:hypothetical protein
MSNTNKLAENRTYKLDQVTTTKLEWSIMFLKELGISAPTQRAILSRALDYYQEYLEDLNITFNCNPKHADLRKELAELIKLNQERPSSWQSLEMPKIGLDSFGHFPSYSTLAKQYHNPIKHNLPRIKPKKPKTTVSIKPKVPLPDPINDQPEVKLELTNCPDVGNVVYPSKTI